MKWGKRLLAGAAFAALAATSAEAADLTPIMPAEPPMAPVMPAPAFSWSGPYIGHFSTLVHCSGCIPFFAIQSGVRFGYNVTAGNALFGVNGGLLAFFHGPPLTFIAEAMARAGVLLGDKVVLYGQIGVDYFIGPSAFALTAGGGLEVALGRRVSIFGEVMPYWGLPAFVGPYWRFTAGVNWHFGH
jgi:hypothetical protein